MASEFSEPTRMGSFSGLTSDQSLDRLCALAAEALEVEFAALVLRVGAVSRCIASFGLEPRYRSRSWQTQESPIAPDREMVLSDATQSPDIQAKIALLGLERAGFLLRTPVIVTPDHTLALVVADPAPRDKPGVRERRLIEDLKTLMADAFALHAGLLTDPDADVTAAIRLADALAEVATAPHAAVILDRSLKVLGASTRMAEILDVPLDKLIGARHQDISVPMSDAIGALYRRALETRVSPPDFEVVTDEASHGREVYRVTVSPFSPIETRDWFLFVTTRETTALARRESQLARRIGAGEVPAEPSLAFLQETLVQRRTIRSRKTISYLTFRAWRSPIREWQIKALKALKANLPAAMPEVIADEMFAEINALVGVSAFRAVVPVPCGHSREGPCLSLEIARAIAGRIGIPVVQAFATRPLKGVSHPKENARRPPLTLAVPVHDPVLLVDDVATSGAHIEEAVTLLRPHTGSVMAMAWIGGDSA